MTEEVVIKGRFRGEGKMGGDMGLGFGAGAGATGGLWLPFWWCLPFSFSLPGGFGFDTGAERVLLGTAFDFAAVALLPVAFEDAATLGASLAAFFFLMALVIALMSSSFRMLSGAAIPRFLARVANSFLVALFNRSRFIVRTLRLAAKPVPTGTACIRAGASNPAKHLTWKGPHYSSSVLE